MSCCSGRASCMVTSRCMLPWLRSAPYPAVCPSEPLRPVGDMKAVSYGARSRQYSPLLPASSSQPRSIAQRPRSGPMGRVHTCMQAFYKRPRHASKTPSVASLLRPCLIINTRCRAWLDQLSTNYSCLLYTSPSPRDLSTSRMPSSA